MLLPINLGNTHWVCAVVDFPRQRIEYYDSMSDGGRRNKVFAVSDTCWSATLTLQNIREYLRAEHQEKKGTALDLSDWTDVYSSVSINGKLLG